MAGISDKARVIAAIDDALKLIPVGSSAKDDPDAWTFNGPPFSLAARQKIGIVIDVLKREPALARLDPCWIRTGGVGGHRVEFTTIARALVNRAAIVGASTVVDSFDTALAGNRAQGVSASAIAGAAVKEAFDLPNGLSLLPFESLPPTYGRYRVRQQFQNAVGIVQLPPIGLLASRYEISPWIVSPDEVALHRGISKVSVFTLMEETARALTLAGPRAIMIVGSWDQIIVEGLSGTGGGCIVNTIERSAVHQNSATFLDPREACEVVNLFFRAPASLRADLSVPIDRLNRAIREPNIVDRAIDLGIALEALLLHGLPDDRGELSYRLSLCGALLLGGTEEVKAATYRQLRDLYNLRSNGVHTGRLKGSKEIPQKLETGFILCANLIKAILSLGHWPDTTKLALGLST